MPPGAASGSAPPWRRQPVRHQTQMQQHHGQDPGQYAAQRQLCAHAVQLIRPSLSVSFVLPPACSSGDTASLRLSFRSGWSAAGATTGVSVGSVCRLHRPAAAAAGSWCPLFRGRFPLPGLSPARRCVLSLRLPKFFDHRLFPAAASPFRPQLRFLFRQRLTAANTAAGSRGGSDGFSFCSGLQFICRGCFGCGGLFPTGFGFAPCR